VIQTFVVGVGNIRHGDVEESQQALLVDYPVLLLSSLKACLRSVMLSNCLYSVPLLNAIMHITKVAYLD